MADIKEFGTKEAVKSDFDLCVSAKNGDSEANLQLWKRYKPYAVTLLKSVPGLTVEEKLSEAYMVFLHKLDYFDPKKVLEARNPDSFTFSYMMTGGLKNLRQKLFSELRRNVREVSWTPFEDEQEIDRSYGFTEWGTDRQEKYCIPNDAFTVFSPETVFLRDSDYELSIKTNKLYEKLTEVQRKILNLRGKGLTLKEIGEELQCSCFVVKYQFKKIKYKVARIFGNRPELKIVKAS
jgi:RNA polymerase sigma factor (sigma-70 family)